MELIDIECTQVRQVQHFSNPKRETQVGYFTGLRFLSLRPLFVSRPLFVYLFAFEAVMHREIQAFRQCGYAQAGQSSLPISTWKQGQHRKLVLAIQNGVKKKPSKNVCAYRSTKGLQIYYFEFGIRMLREQTHRGPLLVRSVPLLGNKRVNVDSIRQKKEKEIAYIILKPRRR